MEHVNCHLSLQEEEQFHLYNVTHSITLSPDDFDIAETQQAIVECIKTQLDACTQIIGRAHTGVSLLHSTLDHYMHMHSQYQSTNTNHIFVYCA